MCTHTRVWSVCSCEHSFFEEPRRGHWMLWNWSFYTIFSHHMCARNWSQILCKSNRWFWLTSQLFSPVSFITRRIRERECMVQLNQVCEVRSKSFHFLHIYSRQLFIHPFQSLFYISCHVFLWRQYEMFNLHWIHLVISYSILTALYLASCIYLLK